MSRKRSKGTGWLTAKTAIATAAGAHLGEPTKISVGWVNKIGEGLYRDVYAAPVEAGDGADRVELAAAALVPRWDAPGETDERVRSEVALLRRIARLDLPFRVPGWAEGVEAAGHTILVREFVRGAPLDLFYGSRSKVEPWQVTGTIAAAVHAMPADILDADFPAQATRRAHAETCLAEIAAIADEPVADDALAWFRAHLPPEEPSCLVHGDLLAQNILLDLEERPALIDWEYSRLGDPAYDLAIVTRGGKRPFKQRDGLARLLDAYNAAAANELRPTEVQLYEVYLHLLWLMESINGDGKHPPETSRDRLRGLLRRIGN